MAQANQTTDPALSEQVNGEKAVFATQATTAFSIASGIASGMGVLLLTSKFSGKQVTRGSVALAIVVVVGVSLGAALLIKEFKE